MNTQSETPSAADSAHKDAGEQSAFAPFNPERLATEIAEQRRRMAAIDFIERDVLPLLLKCSDSVTPELSGGIPYFYVYRREDLAVLMTLAPRWDKSKSGKAIHYTATVCGVRFYLIASEGALPPTCRVVKEVVMVPATEAHAETRETIICEVAA